MDSGVEVGSKPANSITGQNVHNHQYLKFKEVIMKGSAKVIKALNSLLQDELTAVDQYMVHAEICDNWGYAKLHDNIQKRAIDEMKHAEKLIGRIIFLEAIPIVSNLNPMHIGAEVPKMFGSDHVFESDAIKAYNSAILVCGEEKDYATREILEHILTDEDRHIDGIEEVQGQITQMGLQVFLSTQMA
jgi:bacterioferritin